VRNGTSVDSHLLLRPRLPIIVIVDEVLPNSRYRVTLDNGVVVGVYASGRIRKNNIRILAGDQVKLKLSVYDLTKGRVNF
jgi:translation initiation factor IF-1